MNFLLCECRRLQSNKRSFIVHRASCSQNKTLESLIVSDSIDNSSKTFPHLNLTKTRFFVSSCFSCLSYSSTRNQCIWIPPGSKKYYLAFRSSVQFSSSNSIFSYQHYMVRGLRSWYLLHSSSLFSE